MATFTKRAPSLLHPEPLPWQQATADPYLHRRHSNTQRQIWLSLCRVSYCAQGFFEWFYEDLRDLLELTPKKRCPFHHRGLECKSRKSRDTITSKFGLEVQNEAGQRLTEFCQENALVIANTLFQQNKRRLYT